MSPDDKRRYPRVGVNVRATFRSHRLTTDGFISNLSQGGVFMACPDVDTEGASGEVVLDLPTEAQPIVVAGRVAWVQDDPKGGMGIRFREVPRKHRLALANFMLNRVHRG